MKVSIIGIAGGVGRRVADRLAREMDEPLIVRPAALTSEPGRGHVAIGEAVDALNEPS